MASRYFTFTDGSSNKFWKIDIEIDEEEDEYNFVTTYGKIGTAGQTSEKSFDSAEDCEKEANKVIAQKVKKGYVESEANSTDSIRERIKELGGTCSFKGESLLEDLKSIEFDDDLYSDSMEDWFVEYGDLVTWAIMMSNGMILKLRPKRTSKHNLKKMQVTFCL
ncbi:MAG: WGR domain-containing protein [Deferribacteraceae bacterium]|jgi:predicted DNA-binding WGR domain protein|nr:WGR domain-containing protein [Deferribacteraceae bacterium]